MKSFREFCSTTTLQETRTRPVSRDILTNPQFAAHVQATRAAIDTKDLSKLLWRGRDGFLSSFNFRDRNASVQIVEPTERMGTTAGMAAGAKTVGLYNYFFDHNPVVAYQFPDLPRRSRAIIGATGAPTASKYVQIYGRPHLMIPQSPAYVAIANQADMWNVAFQWPLSPWAIRLTIWNEKFTNLLLDSARILKTPIHFTTSLPSAYEFLRKVAVPHILTKRVRDLYVSDTIDPASVLLKNFLQSTNFPEALQNSEQTVIDHLNEAFYHVVAEDVRIYRYEKWVSSLGTGVAVREAWVDVPCLVVPASPESGMQYVLDTLRTPGDDVVGIPVRG